MGGSLREDPATWTSWMPFYVQEISQTILKHDDCSPAKDSTSITASAAHSNLLISQLGVVMESPYR